MLRTMRNPKVQRAIWGGAFVTFVGGFLLYETSGLYGSARVTAHTAVATVNGRDILYTTWVNATQRLEQEQSQRLGRSLTLDERRQVEQQALDELVSEILLEQEYRRRGISVSDDEILDAARYSPPPAVTQDPELQTEGRFDIEKWQRFLASPAVRRTGQLAVLESYYRTEIPRSKLYEQLASAVYVPDSWLWRLYQRDLGQELVLQ